MKFDEWLCTYLILSLNIIGGILLLLIPLNLPLTFYNFWAGLIVLFSIGIIYYEKKEAV